MNVLRKLPKPVLLACGAGIYVSTTIVVYNYYNDKSDKSVSIKGPGCGCVKDISSAEREATYGKIAAKYDSEISLDEFFMGISLARWWHLGKAKGQVLEIGCGTGRNFQHYPAEVTRLVATDSVPSMIDQAKKKVFPKNPYHYRVDLVLMDSHALRFEDKSFDTVVDTFGLCSYDDPVAVLKEMARCCKGDGTILLIEHGKGHYDWINNIIDSGSASHTEKWGCVWNKDIEGIVKEAGLRVKSSHRVHFGTTYIIEASPI